MTIRVMLAEDHNVVRDGLRLLLNAQPDIEVIGEATTGREAVTLARQNCPDVAVLDISMPDLDGIEATSGWNPKKWVFRSACQAVQWMR